MNTGRLPKGSMIKKSMMAADQVSIFLLSPVVRLLFARKPLSITQSSIDGRL